jgi:acyl-coenzyme A thioesterase PaaI-like protein
MEFDVDVDKALTFFSGERLEDLPPRRRAAWEVGDRLREIIDRLVDTRATTEDLLVIEEHLEAVAERLRKFDHGRRYDGYSEASVSGGSRANDGTNEGPPSGHADFSPLLGRANPLAPPMQFAIEGDRMVADVTFGHAYEGPPGHVHGGIVAAAFDELLGATQALSGSPGMTGRLSVTYRAPTPLHVPLRFDSTLDRVEGRKIFTSGRLFNGETLCAESEGLFISVDFAKIAAMRADRDGTAR